MGIKRDQELVDLFRERSPKAIPETTLEYGKYLHSIAFSVVKIHEDAEECVNDTLLKGWETIPPFLPDSLKAYLATIVRNFSLDCYRKQHSSKRNKDFTDLLEECAMYAPHKSNVMGNPEEALNHRVVADCISNYLKKVAPEKRYLFIRRYYFGDSLKELSKKQDISVNNVKITLYRMRMELKKKLEKEGVFI